MPMEIKENLEESELVMQALEILQEKEPVKSARVIPGPCGDLDKKFYAIAEWENGEIRFAEIRVARGKMDCITTGFDFAEAKSRYEALRWAFSYFMGIIKEGK